MSVPGARAMEFGRKYCSHNGRTLSNASSNDDAMPPIEQRNNIDPTKKELTLIVFMPNVKCAS